ncbi:MAG: hypothetical protein K2Q14_02510 [Gammaproteobacteria bacterium]|nr:hypothetical protein [Gammaproteobacteria bacterium]
MNASSVSNIHSPKEGFAERLNHALDLNSIPPKGKGRQVILAKMFGVSQRGAGKWLEAEVYPDIQKIAVIANGLNVNVEWLAYGTGPINQQALPDISVGTGWKKVPLITWDTVVHLADYTPSIDTKWVWTDVECGPKTYAITVIDDSMEPRYEPGSILIVDPEREPSHQRMVIVRWKKTNTATCTQFLVDGPNRYLRPHNPQYSTTLINENDPQVDFYGIIREVFMKY